MILSGKKMDLLINPKKWITYEEVNNANTHDRPIQSEEGLETEWNSPAA